MLEVKSLFEIKDQKSSTVAMVNFYLPKLDLHLDKCRYIRKKDGNFFVSYPSEKVQNANEDPKYFPYFYFGKKTNDKFQSAAQKAIQEYMQKKKENNIEPSL